jgi:hypothetical protein
MPAGPLDRLGGGSVVQDHHAQKGGLRRALRPFGGEHHRSIIGRTGWQELLVCSSLIQHGMEEMNPLIRIRWRQAKELPWHFLKGMLLQIRQNQEALVGCRG